MTRAQIITSVRNLVNEISSDSGVLLEDEGNLLEYVNDSMEQVVMELMEFMPEQFLIPETISLVANQPNYTLSTPFFQIYKVEKNTTDEAPREIQVVNQIEKPYWGNVGETETEPTACYFRGDTLYFWPTPSVTTANYAVAWLIRPELETMPVNGPTYIPRSAHRLIVYRTAQLIATLLEANTGNFEKLYALRMYAVRQTWLRRVRSQPRFVMPSVEERAARSGRDSTLYDKGWL